MSAKDDSRAKRRYEKPVLSPLGELARGSGACNSGADVATGSCGSGTNPGPGVCHSGSSPGGPCNSGTNK